MNCYIIINDKKYEYYCLEPLIVDNSNITIFNNKTEQKYNNVWSFRYEFLKYYKTYIKRVKTKLENKIIKCPFCEHVDKEKVIYYSTNGKNRFCWGSLTYHLIKEHLYEPKNKFIKYILSLSSLSFFKISVNNMVLFEGLMLAGGLTRKFKYNKKIKVKDKNKEMIKKEKQFTYSEYSGYFDIQCDNKICTMENVEISSYRRYNDEIYMVNFFFNKLDNKKYVFHTHPPTPQPGSRIKTDSIVYEFPSPTDIESFITMTNKYELEGELVFAPEGIYVMSRYDKKKPIKQQKFQNIGPYLKVFRYAYSKYKDIENVEDFYNIVAQDYTFIKELNNVMKNYNIIIYYYPKQKINNVWSYGKIYLPINP